jgi:hypothetical protein
MISLQTQTSTITIDASLLQAASQVYRTLTKRHDLSQWNLKDFSHSCVTEFVEFAKITQNMDMKIPILETHELKDYIQDKNLLEFIETKTQKELLELLFLANFVESTLLRDVCMLPFLCDMRIHPHAVMAPKFGFSLHEPSAEFVSEFKRNMLTENM